MGKTSVAQSTIASTTPTNQNNSEMVQPLCSKSDKIFERPFEHQVCDKNVSSEDTGLDLWNNALRASGFNFIGLQRQSFPHSFNVSRSLIPRKISVSVFVMRCETTAMSMLVL